MNYINRNLFLLTLFLLLPMRSEAQDFESCYCSTLATDIYRHTTNTYDDNAIPYIPSPDRLRPTDFDWIAPLGFREVLLRENGMSRWGKFDGEYRYPVRSGGGVIRPRPPFFPNSYNRFRRDEHEYFFCRFEKSNISEFGVKLRSLGENEEYGEYAIPVSIEVFRQIQRWCVPSRR